MSALTAEGWSTDVGASAALVWALGSRLLTRLEEGDRQLGPLAEELGCPPARLELLLDVLCAMGLSERCGERVGLARGLRALLPQLPGKLDDHARLWQHLPHFLAGGPAWLAPGMAARDARYAGVVAGLGRAFEPAARALAAALGPCEGPILDVGAGSGVWSLAMAQLSPQACVTALDGPETLAVFCEGARELGLEARADTLAGDYHAVALPEKRYARVVAANVLHLEPPARAAALIGRLAPALAPGGTLVMVDVISDGEPEHAVDRAVYALHLAMRVEEAAVHARADFEGWAAAGGLPVQRWRALGRGLWALEARAC